MYVCFIEYSHRPEQPKLAEALFGKARFYVQRYNFTHALDMLNQVVAGYPGFLPALIEKMKVQLTLQDWEQAVETAQRWVREGGWEGRRGEGGERDMCSPCIWYCAMYCNVIVFK